MEHKGNAGNESGKIQPKPDSKPQDENSEFELFIDVLRSEIEKRKIAEENFRAIFSTGTSAFALIDYDSTFSAVNEAFCRLSGYNSLELTGVSWTKLISPEDVERFAQAIERIIQDPRNIQDSYEITFYKKDGEKGYVLLSISLLEHEKKFFVSFIDITDRKKAEIQNKMLSREIIHRVKNNLQVVVSLIKLQSNFIANPELSVYFTAISNRITSMALIQRQLYKSPNLSEIDFSDYIKDLVSHLHQNFCKDRNKGNEVVLIVNADSIKLGIDSAIPCGLLINEIVSNVFNHGISDNLRRTVIIDFTYQNEEYILKISDEGIGTYAYTGNSNTSLGTELIEVLASQLDADLTINFSVGTEYIIRFKNPKYSNRV